MSFLVLALFFGLSAGTIGRIKGNSFFIWFMIGAVLLPFGVLAALLSRDERLEDERQCDRCGKIQPLHTQMCTACGLDLDLPENGF